MHAVVVVVISSCSLLGCLQTQKWETMEEGIGYEGEEHLYCLKYHFDLHPDSNLLSYLDSRDAHKAQPLSPTRKRNPM